MSKKQQFKFQDLIDLPALNQILSRLYEVAGIPSAIIDMEGNVLTWSGGERICEEFYRKHPEAEKVCIQSDIQIREEIGKGKPYAIYKCPHGLVDSCAPIVIEGHHVANVFTGQMLHTPINDEIIEEHRSLARQYEFDEDDYLSALREVLVFPIEKHKAILDVLTLLAGQITKMGLANLRILEHST